MSRWTKCLQMAVAFLALACAICGEENMEKQGEVQHVAVPAIAPRNEDISTIEGIVKASYETISGGVGVPRQWGRDRTLVCAERSIRFSFQKQGWRCAREDF